MSGLQDQGIKLYYKDIYHLSSLFSIKVDKGMSVIIVRKYMIDAVWPIAMKGYSTG